MPPSAESIESLSVLDSFPVEDEPADVTLRCVVLHGDEHVLEVLESVAQGSRYPCEFTFVDSVTDARQVLDLQEMDIALLQQVSGDGEGLAFARALARDARTSSLPVIILTSSEAETQAGEILRAGAADYLVEDGLSSEAFDQAVENALRRGTVEVADQRAVISNLESENAMLRRVALRNMRLLKHEAMPLLAFAWQSMSDRDPQTQETQRMARRLSRITRTMMGLIDDTVIVSATHRAVEMAGPVDLEKVARRIIEDDCGEIRLSSAHIRIRDLPVVHAREAMISMLFEELFVNMVRNARLGHVPQIDVGASVDPEGNPILWLKDSGVRLSARKQSLAQRYSGLNDLGSPRQDSLSWSLCQRLAEKCGGTFKLSETEEGQVQVSIRFPASEVIAREDPVRP